MTTIQVEIVELATGKVVETMGAASHREAERIEYGAQINLDRTRFFTRVTEK